MSRDFEREIEAYTLNILECYYAADSLSRAAGAEWYRIEGDKCTVLAAELGKTREAICGAAAAISPGMRWDMVLSHVVALTKDPNVRVPTYNREFVRRAVRCLNGENPLDVLGGDKVRAFYALLMDQRDDTVVVDGHACNIARGEWVVFRARQGCPTPAAARVWPERYARIAEAYRRAAAALDIPPHEVQAATWIFWRKTFSED